MTIEKNPINGAWYVSDMIDNHLVSMQYFHYTRAEAVAAFNLYYYDQITKPTKGDQS